MSLVQACKRNIINIITALKKIVFSQLLHLLRCLHAVCEVCALCAACAGVCACGGAPMGAPARRVTD